MDKIDKLEMAELKQEKEQYIEDRLNCLDELMEYIVSCDPQHTTAENLRDKMYSILKDYELVP